uniref:Uncharacterized protein n=1 Tax=Castor canadensis TaxID=51338 RepID=A0A8C0ZPZ9_CASCN
AAARPTQRQHKIPAVTCKSTHEKENRFPKPPQAQEVTEENSHHAHRSSSLASNSLQETWQLLDLGSSPSGLPSQDDSIPALPAAHSLQEADRSSIKAQAVFAIKGMKVAAQSKAKPARPSRCDSVKPKCCQRRPLIRNYNLKD